MNYGSEHIHYSLFTNHYLLFFRSFSGAPVPFFGIYAPLFLMKKNDP